MIARIVPVSFCVLVRATDAQIAALQADDMPTWAAVGEAVALAAGQATGMREMPVADISVAAPPPPEVERSVQRAVEAMKAGAAPKPEVKASARGAWMLLGAAFTLGSVLATLGTLLATGGFV